MNTFSLSQSDLESLADTYDKIRDLYKLHSSQTTNKHLSQDLDLHLRKTISDLSDLVSSESIPEVLEIYIFSFKSRLFDICIEKLLALPSTSVFSSLIQEIFSKISQIFSQLIDKCIKIVKKSHKDKSNYSQSSLDLEKVLNAAEDLEATIMKLKKENQALMKEIDRVSNEKNEYIAHLEKENKGLLEKIVKNVKQSLENSEIMSKSMDFRESRLYSPIRSRPTTPTPPLHDLTLKQTKDIIEELYVNKAKFDLTTFENKLPRETFENFLNIHFSQKYGLKTLCNQWLNLLSKACARFESDVNVKIFRKIRNNEINEEFLSLLKQLKEKVSEIIKNFFRNKHPYMQEKIIKVMQDEVMNNDVDEEIWNFVLTCFVGKGDLIKGKLVNFMIPSKNVKKGRIVSYIHLINVLSEVILEEYELKISSFYEMFKKVDIETKGFITPQQFCEIFEGIGVDRNVEKCVESLDPFKSNRIVFSDFIVFCLGEKPGYVSGNLNKQV